MLRANWIVRAALATGLLLPGCQSAPILVPQPAKLPAATRCASPPPASPPAANGAPSVVLATHNEQVASPPVALPPTEAIAPGVAVPGTNDAGNPLRLDLVQSVEMALVQNPDLQTIRQNEGVGRGVLGVAQTYPFNPFVQVQATPLQYGANGAGPGTIYHYVLLMQTLQLAHQQRFREESGLAALSSVRWNIHQAELLNLAQTERLFFTALYQRGIRDLALANAKVNEELLDVLERQLRAGHASAADVAIVRVDSRSTRKQAQLAEANYQTALLDLRRQLGLDIGAPFEPSGDLAEFHWLSTEGQHLRPYRTLQIAATVDAPGEMANLVAGRPDVMAARADLAAARANADLARAARRPDLQIGPYYQRTEQGTTYWGFRAQSDVPVVNNGLPMVRQREAEVRQRFAAWRQLQTRAQLEAAAAIDRYQRAWHIVNESQQGLEEPLPAELERLEEQFKAGEVDILRVFTARSSLLQWRRAQLDMLNEVAQAAANVTAATGLAPDALIGP